jgi:hypothetical protein
MLDNDIRLGLLVLSWAVVLVRIPAVKSPSQRPLWFTLLTLGLGITLLQPAPARVINHLTSVATLSSLVSGLLAICLITAVLTFAIRMSAPDRVTRGAGHRLRRGLALATGVVMTTSFAIAVARHTPTRPRFLAVPATFSAVTVYWVAYLAYLITAGAWAGLLFWRQLPRLHTTISRTATLLLGTAVTVHILYALSRAMTLFSVAPVWTSIGLVTSSMFFVLVALGCSVAVIEPWRERAVSWWRCAQLYGLWKALCDAVPNIALDAPRPRLIDLLSVRNSQTRLYRRLIEIRDGFLVMREWITPCDLDDIRMAVARSGQAGAAADAVVTACWLAVASQARRTGTAGLAAPPDLVQRGGQDTRSEVRWLCAVAAARRSTLARGYATAQGRADRAGRQGGPDRQSRETTETDQPLEAG